MGFADRAESPAKWAALSTAGVGRSQVIPPSRTPLAKVQLHRPCGQQRNE